ncbi:MAG: gluconate 2-dehydrogenase subunit 3 family protein [Chitinophagaceae bacterium]|nr:gluconate 2-dehydrogenase subunit 3 family protein [Chitinophagaceae bacterium]
MDRRELLKNMGFIGGPLLFPSVLSHFLASCRNGDIQGYTPLFFTEPEYRLVTEITDIIIPETGTPSATQVFTPVLLDQVYRLCITEEEQTALRKGLKETASGWDRLASAEKVKRITELDKNAFANREQERWFRDFKKFTLIGFFTSEQGSVKAALYTKVPDEWKADIPAGPETLNNANTSLHF